VASFEIRIDSGQAVGRIKAKEPVSRAREKAVFAAYDRFEKDLVTERNKDLAEMRTAENRLKEVNRLLGSKIEIEPEGELRDVSLSSLRVIKERERSYRAQLYDLVRRSNPVERTEIVGVLGQNTYDRMTGPEESPSASDFTVPHQKFDPMSHPEPPQPYHQKFEPAEKPPAMPEGPG
jgi:hypothetical protein